MATTTLTQLDYKFREKLGALEVMHRWPSVFMAPNGENLVGLESWEAGMFDLKTYGKEKWYEWPLQWSVGFPFTPGGIGDTSVAETGSHAKMYNKKVFAPIKLDTDLAHYKNGEIELSISPDELSYRLDVVNKGLAAYYQQTFWNDGVGRRARVYSVDDYGGVSCNRWYLQPLMAINAAPGALDATKYLLEDMFIRVGLWDETAVSGVGSGSWFGATTNLLRIREIHVGTTACGGADGPYIITTPYFDSSTLANPTYYYIFIEHPKATGTADVEVQGVWASLGEGYNAHTRADAAVNNAAYPSFGRRVYATVDRFTTDAYRRFRGYVYNRYLGTPCAAVALTTAVIDEWMRGFYANSPRGTQLSCLVANSALRSKVSTVFASQGTVFLNDTEIPHRVGFRSAAFIDCYGGGASRIIPWFFCDDAPRGGIFGFDFRSLKHATVVPGEWAPGDPGKGPFRDMRNITWEEYLQALYQREEMFIQFKPAAQTACLFVTE